MDPFMNIARRVVFSFLLAAGTAVSPAMVWAQPPAAVAPAANVDAVASDVWAKARANDLDGVVAAGEALPADSALGTWFKTLKANLAKREMSRTAQIEKVTKKLDELMATDTAPLTLSKALKEAVELHMLTKEGEKVQLLASERMQKLMKQSDAAARKAEKDGDWLMANELFGRLNLLLEDLGTYKPDAERLVDRLGMIRLYTPQRFWDLRDARQKMDKDAKPLPPFNATGEEFKQKLKGITSGAVLTALSKAADGHVERVPMRTMLAGGLDHVRTLLTTHDLEKAFPGIANPETLATMLKFVDKHTAELKASKVDPTDFQVSTLVNEMLITSADSVKVPAEVLLHEFGNGAFGELDEFSAIIWPAEVAAFNRITGGSFNGVGIQIQLDEESQLIKVVQPIDGTPAQRAGVKAGDFIKKIGETSAIGMSLDQAIEQITGPRGTHVVLTMERAGQDVPFDLIRSKIPIRTARGWKRTGTGDSDWDYFVDHESKIGYVRLSGFNENTTTELHAAVRQMQEAGVNGIILDLRFNPGGLLDQAVSVANTFVAEGNIVSTRSFGGVREQEEDATPNGQLVKNGVPIVVLINNGAASASEIVSGAIRFYGNNGAINAVVMGERSFGKGSVQNVMTLTATGSMQMKLTRQYYYLPDGVCIHKRPGAKEWGVEPNLKVEMLPKQIADAYTLRVDADTPPEGRVVRKVLEGEEPLGDPDPQRLLTEGFDLQLETAVVVLKAQAAARSAHLTAHNTPLKGG
jgi:carboxyl-terminal processing protease